MIHKENIYPCTELLFSTANKLSKIAHGLGGGGADLQFSSSDQSESTQVSSSLLYWQRRVTFHSSSDQSESTQTSSIPALAESCHGRDKDPVLAKNRIRGSAL